MKILFVRHGQADYSEVDKRQFIGQGRDLAPLSDLGVSQIKETALNDTLKGSELIISSPYTRALQSASILSKELGIDIKIEVGLHEWIPNIKDYTHKSTEECMELYRDYHNHNGVYPDETKVWETKKHLVERVEETLKKYKEYNKIIVVCHGMVIESQTGKSHLKNGEVVEYLL